MRAFQRQIRATWLAQSEDLPDTEPAEVVGVSLALAAAAVRVLDLEVFEAVHGARYRHERDSSQGGHAVNGLTLVRNAEIHLPTIISPVSNILFGSHTDPAGSSWKYTFDYVTWALYENLPEEVRLNTRTATRCHKGYIEGLQGRSVTETLLDVFCFFQSLDPAITARDTQGNLDSFPLPPSNGSDYAYYRLHPNEPTQEDVLKRLTMAATERNPNTAWREICFVFRGPSEGAILRFAGYQKANTLIGGEHRGVGPWVDYPELVLRDVQRGLDHWLVDGAERYKVRADHGLLFAGDTELSALSIPDAPDRPDWWQILLSHSSDIFRHCRNRGLDWRDVVTPDELLVQR